MERRNDALNLFFFLHEQGGSQDICHIFPLATSIFEGYMYVYVYICVSKDVVGSHIPAIVIGLDPWHQW